MKRKLFIVVFLCICAGLFLSCQRADTDTVTLRFSSWRTEDVAVYAEIIEMFRRQNPGINVLYQPYRTEEYQTILATHFQGGTAADIIHLRAYGNFEQFAAPGFLMPLTEVEVPELTRFSSQSLMGSTSRATGRVYGVPYASQSLVIFYNRDVYDRLNLRVPETWGEFLSNLQAIQNANMIPLSNGTFAGWAAEVMWGTMAPNFYGGNDFWDGIQAGTTNFLDPRFIRSLEAWQDLHRFMPSGFTALDYVDQQMMFVNEMSAHFLGGIWEAAHFSTVNPDLNFGAFIAPPINRGDPQHISFYMDGSFGVNASTNHRVEALRFLNFLASREVHQILSDRLGVMTEHPDVVVTNPFLRLISAPHLVQTPYVFLVGFRYEHPNGSALMQAGLQAIAGGQQTPLQVATDIQTGIATYHRPFW